ncbi:MAG: hypothetical protein WC297_01840 [Candidatus Paceibacterota bacterium]|jgi:hypothetical protein
MILTPHILVGAAIGLKIKNPWLGFLAGLISHLILDAIPHREYGQEDSGKKIKAMRFSTILKVLLDISIGFGLIYSVYVIKPFIINFWAIAGVILPDIISGLSWQFPNKFFTVLTKFHLFHAKKFDGKFGIIIQVFVSAIALYFICQR